MTILAEIGGTITVTADSSPEVLGFLEITDADPFLITLDVDARASVAAAQRFQRLGLRIRKDRGDGVMVTIPESMLAKVLTINESADSYGDTLSFRVAGEKWSPFARAELRRKSLVTVEAKYGANPTNEFEAQIFKGYVIKAPFDVQPPTATVECMDAAALFAERTAKTYYLPPNSGRTRLSIGLELCALVGIPVGSIDLGGDGGIVVKPVAPGATPIVDFLRDFWGILGVEIGGENGKLCAYRYSASDPPSIILTPANLLIPASLDHPDTLAANVTGVVSVAYERIEPNGYRTEEESIITTGPYAPVTASGNWPTEIRVISEVTTRTTFYGSLDVRMEQEEFGWYARQAAGVQIQFDTDPPGYEIVAISPVNYYTYVDGSTRADPVEQFRLTRKVIRTKDLDANNNVIRIEERRHFYRFVRKAIWQVTGGDDVLITSGGAIALSDDGQGLMHPRELNGLEGGSALLSRATEYVETDITLNADGTIREEKITEHFYDPGQELRRADGAHGYGAESVTYSSLPAESDPSSGHDWGGIRTTTKRYRAVNEDTYELTETIRDGTGAPTVRTSRLIGALPRPEKAEAETSSQEIRSEVEDLERIFYAGEEIENVEHNEYVETAAEARAYALVLARRAAAIKLDCAVGFEALAHKFRMAEVRIPGASIDGLKFYIRTVNRDAATFREGIAAEHYPPSLA